MKREELLAYVKAIQDKRTAVFAKVVSVKANITKANQDETCDKIHTLLIRVNKKLKKADDLITDSLDLFNKIRAYELELEYAATQPVVEEKVEEDGQTQDN